MTTINSQKRECILAVSFGFDGSRYTGVPYDQNSMSIRLGTHSLMEAGQPLDFDASKASEYLRDTCAEHGTVEIAVAIGAHLEPSLYVCRQPAMSRN